MAKFKTQPPKPKSKFNDLVSHDIPLPEEAHVAIREGAPPAIFVRFSKDILQKTQEITDSLLISRKILNPDTINQNDPHVMMLALVDKDRPIEDVIYEVQYFHKKWALEAQRDAGFIALTLRTKLADVDPKPYTAAELADEEEDGEEPAPEREDWEGHGNILPPPPRNLSNSYERRLKQFLDMLDLTDMMFQVRVGQLLNNVFIDALRLYGAGETSDANFQPGPVDAGSHISLVPNGGKKRNTIVGD